MTIKTPKNPNYCATVVEITKLVPLANCNNVQAAIVFGNQVIVGMGCQIKDIGLYFPVETQLTQEFLSNNNLYSRAELNQNPKKKGYFEPNGRIRCQKFRGHKSEGFFVPLSFLEYLKYNKYQDLKPGLEFDALNDKEICRKYVVRHPNESRDPNSRKTQKKMRRLSRLVPGQFYIAPDTAQLAKNLFKINPEDTISITAKWHGCNTSIGNVLTKRPLRWYEKVAKFLGVKVQESEFNLIWASRRVVKNEWLEDPRLKSGHYFKYDLWGEVAAQIKESVQPGYTIYGEITGYLKDGGQIQNGYHYGCEPGNWRLTVYRITHVNAVGQVLELSLPQRLEYCQKYGLDHVPVYFYGKAKDLFDIKVDWNWNDEFMANLKKEFLEKECRHNPGMPDEGIVLVKETAYDFEPFKLKSFRFLERESKLADEGIGDLQDVEVEDAAG